MNGEDNNAAYVDGKCGLEIDRDLNAAYDLVNQLPKAIGEVKPVDRLDLSAFVEDRDEAGIKVYNYVHRK